MTYRSLHAEDLLPHFSDLHEILLQDVRLAVGYRGCPVPRDEPELPVRDVSAVCASIVIFNLFNDLKGKDMIASLIIVVDNKYSVFNNKFENWRHFRSEVHGCPLNFQE